MDTDAPTTYLTSDKTQIPTPSSLPSHSDDSECHSPLGYCKCIRCYYTVQDSLELTIVLDQPSECWGYKAANTAGLYKGLFVLFFGDRVSYISG